MKLDGVLSPTCGVSCLRDVCDPCTQEGGGGERFASMLPRKAGSYEENIGLLYVYLCCCSSCVTYYEG